MLCRHVACGKRHRMAAPNHTFRRHTRTWLKAAIIVPSSSWLQAAIRLSAAPYTRPAPSLSPTAGSFLPRGRRTNATRSGLSLVTAALARRVVRWLRPKLLQQGLHGLVALHIEGSPAVFVLRVHIDAVPQQDFSDAPIVRGCRSVQRRRPSGCKLHCIRLAGQQRHGQATPRVELVWAVGQHVQRRPSHRAVLRPSRRHGIQLCHLQG